MNVNSLVIVNFHNHDFINLSEIQQPFYRVKHEKTLKKVSAKQYLNGKWENFFSSWKFNELKINFFLTVIIQVTQLSAQNLNSNEKNNTCGIQQ